MGSEKRWQIERRAKVAQIRDAAVLLFCRQGYAGTSLQDVAKATNIHKATLYHYFESKEHLLANILDYAHDQMIEIVDSVKELDVDPVERLRSLLRQQLCWFLENIELARVTFHEWTNVGDELIEEQTNRRRVYDGYLRSLIRDIEKAGLIGGPLNIGLAANYIIGAMNAAPAWFARSGSLRADEVAEIYTEMALRAIDAQPPSRASTLVRREQRHKSG